MTFRLPDVYMYWFWPLSNCTDHIYPGDIFACSSLSFTRQIIKLIDISFTAWMTWHLLTFGDRKFGIILYWQLVFYVHNVDGETQSFTMIFFSHTLQKFNLISSDAVFFMHQFCHKICKRQGSDCWDCQNIHKMIFKNYKQPIPIVLDIQRVSSS